MNSGNAELSKLLVNSFSKGKPVAAVFNAECCPSTKEFFDQHRVAAQQIENKYNDKDNLNGLISLCMI